MPKRSVTSAVDPIDALAERVQHLEDQREGLTVSLLQGSEERLNNLEAGVNDLSARVGGTPNVLTAPLCQRVNKVEKDVVQWAEAQLKTAQESAKQWRYNMASWIASSEAIEQLRELTKPEKKPRKSTPWVAAFAFIVFGLGIVLGAYLQHKELPPIYPGLYESDLFLSDLEAHPLEESPTMQALLSTGAFTSSKSCKPGEILAATTSGGTTCILQPSTRDGAFTYAGTNAPIAGPATSMPKVAEQIIVTNSEPRDCWVGRGKEHTTLHANDTWQLPPFDHPVTIRDGCPGALTFTVDGKIAHPANKAKHPKDVEVVELP